MEHEASQAGSVVVMEGEEEEEEEGEGWQE